MLPFFLVEKVMKPDWKFPMKALGKCEVAGVEYAPGAEFDARTKHSRDYLVQQRAAVDLLPTPEPAGMAPVSGATPDGARKLVDRKRTAR